MLYAYEPEDVVLLDLLVPPSHFGNTLVQWAPQHSMDVKDEFPSGFQGNLGRDNYVLVLRDGTGCP